MIRTRSLSFLCCKKPNFSNGDEMVILRIIQGNVWNSAHSLYEKEPSIIFCINFLFMTIIQHPSASCTYTLNAFKCHNCKIWHLSTNFGHFFGNYFSHFGMLNLSKFKCLIVKYLHTDFVFFQCYPTYDFLFNSLIYSYIHKNYL